ncbi:uncharacterized protein LOC125185668 [Salvia hispanica]|uniref:uncharacterized protein LOC125185668 n=1 Tax=Salvia hispanica TaxID=49212 RepID=UPI0020092CEE|nr:uncharacterized protein LOC125185668 [Salvia hispanica]
MRVMATAKSSRFASSNNRQSGPGVGSSIAAALLISPKKPESTQGGMRFLNIEVLDDTALIDTSIFSKKTTRPRKDWKIKNIKKASSYSYSRAEMLSLNLHHPHSNKWSQIYHALPASVAAEYDQLLAFSPRPIFSNDGGVTAIGKRRSPLKISVH